MIAAGAWESTCGVAPVPHCRTTLQFDVGRNCPAARHACLSASTCAGIWAHGGGCFQMACNRTRPAFGHCVSIANHKPVLDVLAWRHHRRYRHANRTATHVAISVSSSQSARARNETYFENAIVAALNWAHQGFVVLLVLVQDSERRGESAVARERALLGKLEQRRPGQIRTRTVSVAHSFAFVAQRCRMALAHLFGLDDSVYMRLTDGDMLCGDPSPFADFPGPQIAHAFNGGCCGTKQYPMHSMGMRAGSWKSIASPQLCEAPDRATWQRHGGGPNWFSDQLFLRAAVDGCVSNQSCPLRRVELQPGPSNRINVAGPSAASAKANGIRQLISACHTRGWRTSITPSSAYHPTTKPPTDIHLAGIYLHHAWVQTVRPLLDRFGLASAEDLRWVEQEVLCPDVAGLPDVDLADPPTPLASSQLRRPPPPFPTAHAVVMPGNFTLLTLSSRGVAGKRAISTHTLVESYNMSNGRSCTALGPHCFPRPAGVQPVPTWSQHAHRTHSYPWLTGDTLRFAATWVVDETVTLLVPEEMQPMDVVFVKTDRLPDFRLRFLPRIRSKFVLISHNSALSPPPAEHQMLEHPHLLRWFAQNANHPRIIPLPLGVPNRRWPHGNTTAFAGASCPPDEQFQVYNRPFARTHSLRSSVHEHFRAMPGCRTFDVRMSFAAHLHQLACSSWTVCPPGRGIDTHCTWEALMLGSRPVVQNSSLAPLYAHEPNIRVELDLQATRDLPFVPPSNMSKRTASLLVTFDYWWARITAAD